MVDIYFSITFVNNFYSPKTSHLPFNSKFMLKQISFLLFLVFSCCSLYSQNVGVGTSSPASKLDIEGGVSIGASYSGSIASPANGAIIEGTVGIGTSNPNASALLHLNSASRGLLIPNVALTATNTAGPVAAPAASLLVYNTAISGVSPNNVTPGFYFWNGGAWQRFDTGNNTGETPAQTSGLPLHIYSWLLTICLTLRTSAPSSAIVTCKF